MADSERTNIGRVAIIPKGDFVFGMQYYKLDLVTDNGNTYLAIADSKDVAVSDTNAWKKIVDGDAITKEFYDTLSYSEAGPNNVIHVTDAAPYPAKLLTTGVNYEQDLHGYDYPWPGGQNKNLLPETALDWANHSNAGIGYQKNPDGSISFHGTATANVDISIFVGGESETILNSGDFIMNGLASGAANTYMLTCRIQTGDSPRYLSTFGGQDMLVRLGEGEYIDHVYLRILSGTTVPSGTLAYPMIRVATNNDSTYAPYENLCPIVGSKYKNIAVSAKNPGEGLTYQWQYSLNGTAAWANSSLPGYNTDTITVPLIASRMPYYYRCRITNSAGTQLTSEAAHVIASAEETPAPTPVIGYVDFAITKQPENVVAQVGDTVQFSVRAIENGYTYNIAYPDEAGNVYGGTLEVNQDGSGTLTVTHGYKEISGNMLSSVGVATSTGYPYAFAGNVATAPANSLLVSNIYRGGVTAPPALSEPPAIRYTTSGSVFIYDRRFTTLTIAREILNANPLYIRYEMSTPQTYSLTATQVRTMLGENYISSDTGTLSIVYAVDADLAFDEIKYSTFFAKGENKDGLAVSYRTGLISVNGTKSDTQALFFTIQPEGAKYASRMIVPTGNIGGAPNIPLKQGHKYALRGTFTRPTASLRYGLYLAYKNAATDGTWQKIEIHSSTSTAPTETPTITFDHMGKLFLGVTATTSTAVSDTINFVLEDITEAEV